MIKGLAKIIAYCYKSGGKVLICGNGGLAAEAEHFAGELMGKFGREVFIPCIALTPNSALITAISNDMGFEEVFAHQVRVLGNRGDVLIAMTTSKSVNIIKAVRAGVEKGMITILLNKANLGGNDVAEIQENALKLLHRVAREAKELV